MLAVAKISSKGQTTIPQEVRTALHVGAGDLIAWEVDDHGVVTVRRVPESDREYLKSLESTLNEWSGSADDEAYRDL